MRNSKGQFVKGSSGFTGKHTETTKKLISLHSSHHIAWNKGKKTGLIPWNKGTKGICKAWNKGLPCRDYTKQMVSIANKGNKYCVGKKLSKEHKEKLSKSHIGETGKLAGNWKGGISINHHSLTDPKYKNWRNEIFKRDNYKCKINNH